MIIRGQVVDDEANGTFRFSARRRGEVCKSTTVAGRTGFVGGAP